MGCTSSEERDQPADAGTSVFEVCAWGLGVCVCVCVLQTSNLLPVRKLGEVLFLPSRCLRVPGTAPPCQEAERCQQEGSMGTAIQQLLQTCASAGPRWRLRWPLTMGCHGLVFLLVWTKDLLGSD